MDIFVSGPLRVKLYLDVLGIDTRAKLCWDQLGSFRTGHSAPFHHEALASRLIPVPTQNAVTHMLLVWANTPVKIRSNIVYAIDFCNPDVIGSGPRWVKVPDLLS